MAKPLILVVALGACAQQQSSTPLAQLQTAYGNTHLEIVTNGKINIEMHVDETAGCPLLGDDVHATFDGAPMMVSHGGYDTNASGCYPIAFWFNDAPMATLTGFEKVSMGSELVVADKSQTWSVNTVPLFANDFIVDTANSQILWTDVSTITSAEIVPGAPLQISGNAITYPAGLSVQWVSALAHPIPSVCDGPGLCTVNLQGSRNFLAGP
jgi:hypothetical protein